MSNRILTLWMACMMLATISAPNAEAQIVDTLEAVADAAIRGDLNARMNDNYGCDPLIVVGGSRGGAGIPYGGADGIRSLVQFDVSAYTQPVTSAIMEITLAGPYSFSPPQIYQLNVHRVIESGERTPWVEGNGTTYTPAPPGCQWVDQAYGVAWVGAGDGGDANNTTQPDFDPTVIAGVTIDETTMITGDVYQWDITSVVNGWIEGTCPNYGLMLRDPTTDGTFKHIFLAARDWQLREMNIPGQPERLDGPRLLVNSLSLVNDRICPKHRNVNWDGANHVFSFDLRLKNISRDDLYAPMRVVLDTLGADNGHSPITVLNADGGGTGAGAYWDYSDLLGPDNKLTRKEKTGYKLWQFYDPEDADFHFFANVYAVLDGSMPKAGARLARLPIRINVSPREGEIQITQREELPRLAVPAEFALRQNYPNPFNPSTRISYWLADEAQVRLTVTNLLGHRVKTVISSHNSAGYHSARWDARDDSGNPVAAGVYLYRLEVRSLDGGRGFVETKKMILMK